MIGDKVSPIRDSVVQYARKQFGDALAVQLLERFTLPCDGNLADWADIYATLNEIISRLEYDRDFFASLVVATLGEQKRYTENGLDILIASQDNYYCACHHVAAYSCADVKAGKPVTFTREKSHRLVVTFYDPSTREVS